MSPDLSIRRGLLTVCRERASAVDCRTMNSGSIAISGAYLPRFSMRSTNVCAAMRSILTSGCRTVVSPGLANAAPGRSSNPTTETSSGRRQPCLAKRPDRPRSGQISCLHVHAPCCHLGHGDDSSTSALVHFRCARHVQDPALVTFPQRPWREICFIPAPPCIVNSVQIIGFL